MAKHQTTPIGQPELLDYLNSVSDFNFELSVLKMLRELDIECEHGGHYEDRVTNKPREFDIRATKTFDRLRVRLAIECKNIREFFPILISCVPRHRQEAYHQILMAKDPGRPGRFEISDPTRPRAKAYSMRGEASLYPEGQPVGKSTVQVGKATDGSIIANDGELYEKWGQCLSSMHDLVDASYWDGERDESEEFFLSAAFPFVVVPNGRLWMATYDADGNRTGDPQPADRVSCFIDRDYEIGPKIVNAHLRLSHVEIVTVDGLRSFIGSYVSSKEAMEGLFDRVGLAGAVMDAADRS